MAGIPSQGWGGWQAIDLDGPEPGKSKPSVDRPMTAEEKQKAIYQEQVEKIRKRNEARGEPVQMNPSGPFPFVIDSHNYKKNCSPDILEPANSKHHWNRLTIIGGAKVRKEEVLDVVIKLVSPCLLIPALYQTDGEDSFFLFREGGMIVYKLMDKCGSFLVMQDSSLEKPLEINFMVQYVSVEDEPLNPMTALSNAVYRRLHIQNDEATLDLRNFENDQEFKNLYVTFKTPRLALNILSIVKKNKNFRRLSHLLLSHNNLDRLDGVEAIVNNPDRFELRVLDLRHNKLTFSGFERVTSLKNWNVYHLLIEGNPIYEDYDSPGEAMHEIRKMMPHIRRLDGADFEFVMDGRVSFKFYTPNPGFTNFVDHFFHHYFSTLENDKDKLVQMYDSKACLSFSVCQNDRSPVPGNFFSPNNRNLISMSNIDKIFTNAFIGKTRILEAFTMMPNMTFDTYSFHIDVPHAYQTGTLLICCTGAFTLPDEPSLQIYTFARTCIVKSDPTVGSWKILNDMWTILNAMPPQSASAYRLSRDAKSGSLKKCYELASRAVKSDFAVMLNPLTKDKEVLKRVVGDLTNMKSAWVEKYLSDSGWDFECTLLSFIDHFKSQLIPHEAFLPFSSS